FDAARGSLASWLLTMARTRAIDRLRARSSRHETFEQGVAALPDRPSYDSGYAEEDFIARERADAIRQAMDALPSAQRSAIELAYFEGLSQSEISQRLGQPLGTVKTRVRLGMSKLKTSLSSYFPPGNFQA